MPLRSHPMIKLLATFILAHNGVSYCFPFHIAGSGNCSANSPAPYLPRWTPLGLRLGWRVVATIPIRRIYLILPSHEWQRWYRPFTALSQPRTLGYRRKYHVGMPTLSNCYTQHPTAHVLVCAHDNQQHAINSVSISKLEYTFFAVMNVKYHERLPSSPTTIPYRSLPAYLVSIPWSLLVHSHDAERWAPSLYQSHNVRLMRIFRDYQEFLKGLVSCEDAFRFLGMSTGPV